MIDLNQHKPPRNQVKFLAPKPASTPTRLDVDLNTPCVLRPLTDVGPNRIFFKIEKAIPMPSGIKADQDVDQMQSPERKKSIWTRFFKFTCKDCKNFGMYLYTTWVKFAWDFRIFYKEFHVSLLPRCEVILMKTLYKSKATRGFTFYISVNENALSYLLKNYQPQSFNCCREITAALA